MLVLHVHHRSAAFGSHEMIYYLNHARACASSYMPADALDELRCPSGDETRKLG
jgi:hypothetical protein